MSREWCAVAVRLKKSCNNKLSSLIRRRGTQRRVVSAAVLGIQWRYRKWPWNQRGTQLWLPNTKWQLGMSFLSMRLFNLSEISQRRFLMTLISCSLELNLLMCYNADEPYKEEPCLQNTEMVCWGQSQRFKSQYYGRSLIYNWSGPGYLPGSQILVSRTKYFSPVSCRSALT